MRRLITIVAFGLIFIADNLRAEDWPAFRGPSRTGIEDRAAPREWSVPEKKNIRWTAPLPAPGNSSPVICAGRVFVSGPSADARERELRCFNADGGQLLWQRATRYEAEDPTHPTNPYGSPSPAADAARVVVWHGSAGVHCYDHDGELLWSRDLGVFRHIWGYAASPVIHDDCVLLHCGPGARQFVAALALSDGRTLWQVDITGGSDGVEAVAPATAPEWIGSWSSPVVHAMPERTEVLLATPGGVQAHDFATGKQLWRVEGLGKLVYADVVLGDGLAFANSADPGAALMLKLSRSPEPAVATLLWRQETRQLQSVGSGVILGGNVYLPNEEGVLHCLNAQTGEQRWKQRLGGGRTWSSALVLDGLLYVPTSRGKVYVVKPQPDHCALIAENDLGEPTNSTPAASAGRLYFRTFGHLVCVEQASMPATASER